MRKQNHIVTLGVTSLFLIFSVLCLVILALLTLGSSRFDLGMSERAMEQTTAYYEACTTATDLCIRAEEFLQNTCRSSATKEEYFSALSGISSVDKRLLFQENSSKILLELELSKTQNLYIELLPLYPTKEGESYLEILTWKTIPAGTWKPEQTQPVYKGAAS